MNVKANITKLQDNLYIFTEGASVDAYLIIGEKKAVLIDSLMATPQLWDGIRKITELPLEVIITHGHGDHIGKATLELMDKGCPVYMDKRDLPMAEAALGKELDDIIIDVTDGMSFDLGGTVLEAISLPGHTPGSIVLLDRTNSWLFSGDAIGSGQFWMQLSCCLPLSELKKNIEHLLDKLAGMKLTVHPGHRHQSPEDMSENYIKDVYNCCCGILDGSIVGRYQEIPHPALGTMKFHSAKLGLIAGFCYDPENL